MGHVARLQLVGSVTYYVARMSLVCGGLFHVNIATGLFLAPDLAQRHLFEVSVVKSPPFATNAKDRAPRSKLRKSHT
jgi:hypothetical protein